MAESCETYNEVPTEHRVRPGHRYTIVNVQPAAVDRGYRIVEIID